jgi:AcrR family transcriptional regulator
VSVERNQIVSPTAKQSERQAEILYRAAQLFDERGYHRATMEDIATAVGLRKPSLYHYFRSKEEILFRIHEEFIDLIISKHLERTKKGLTMTELLRSVMRDIVGLMDTHHSHVRVFFEHYRELPIRYQEKLEIKRNQYQAMVQATLAEGMASGEFRPGDARLISLAVFGMCNWTYQWYRKGGPLTSDQVAEAFHQLLLDGMGPPAPPDTPNRRTARS